MDESILPGPEVVNNTKECRILSFRERLADFLCDNMSDRLKWPLPYTNKTKGALLFKKDYQAIYVYNPPSKTYSIRFWKLHCKSIKFSEASWLVLCPLCIELDEELKFAVDEQNDTADFKQRRIVHVGMILKGWKDYRKRKERAILSWQLLLHHQWRCKSIGVRFPIFCNKVKGYEREIPEREPHWRVGTSRTEWTTYIYDERRIRNWRQSYCGNAA